ncbi:SDR family oxidoreductase [Streptomyces sp. NBC_00080]|uniref:SDR family oxidoreductase n=1 Tax=unclassified Streptomyces TaxID=2593676 RepID=UPI0011511985|nr:SDR family oxidoreductase [Streptomyces sp. SLBN-115]TQJ56859.1 nucleoside-diphosphate-sugar epimerase [Streptomyces sp. SLBN-115]
MRVFITGATGFIGSAVVRELVGAGHRVVGVARSDAGAAFLTSAGAEVYRGDLTDPDGLRSGAATADGVIHLAFQHDFANFEASARTERRAIEALGEELADSGRPFVVTSGTAGLPPGRVGTEDDGFVDDSPAAARMPNEAAALAFAERGVRVGAVRLAPSVHGVGDHGFVPRLIDLARERGVSAYVGDGANRWPAVHRLDAARLYRLALESAPAGSRLHGVDDEGVPFRDIAAAIGRHLDLPVVAVPAAEAGAHFGWLGGLVGRDIPASSALTRKLLDWQPEQSGLLADLDEGHYFGKGTARV